MNIDEKYYFDNLAFKSIQDKNQVILFSDKYKRWFRLNVIGKQILDKMDGNTTIKNIAEGIAQEYEIPCEVVLKDVDNFCIKALDQEFIVEEKSKELLNHRVDLSLSNIYIDVTNKCNLSCAYCSKCVKDEELGVDINFNNLKEYLNLLLEEKKAEDTIVNITGGEPLLNKELRQILEYLKSKKLRVILWTNGFYLDDSNIQWIKENCTFVAIPLDSVNEENNDRIRGKGAYEASIKAINLCKKHNIDVIISATATVFNINELKEIAILGESLEVYSMVINEPIKIDSANNRILEYFDFQEEIIEEKWREILGHTAVLSSWHNYNSDKVVFSACRMQDTCLNSVYSIKQKDSCGAGVNEISIKWDGSIYPCHMMELSGYEIDNMANGSIESLLNYSNVGIKELDNCKDCEVNFICLGGCRAKALYDTNNILGGNSMCQHTKNQIIYSILRPMS